MPASRVWVNCRFVRRKLMSTAHTHATEPLAASAVRQGRPTCCWPFAPSKSVVERALTDARRHEIRRSIDALADEALRTLGIAYRLLPDELAQRCILAWRKNWSGSG
jgi:Ca2+-transporting ATPase